MKTKFSLEDYLRKKELARERTRKWRAKYPDWAKELRAQWFKKNPEKKKSMRREKWKRWYAKSEKNKAKHRAWAKAYYHANKATEQAKRRAWAKANPEKRAVANVAWRKANPEKMKALHAAWRKKNPDKLRLYRLKRRAQKAKVPGTITEKQLRDRAAMFGNRCAYCGGPYETDDHVKPLAKGGANIPANIRPCCRRCNSSKKDRPLKTWVPPARRP